LQYDIDLALTYNTNKLGIEDLVAQLRKEYELAVPNSDRFLRITIHQADLSNADECIRVAEEARKQHGRTVDILVSNAGYGKRITDIWYVRLCFGVLGRDGES
jgi:3-oxoacyl-[acyl-carrier protein] reductase